MRSHTAGGMFRRTVVGSVGTLAIALGMAGALGYGSGGWVTAARAATAPSVATSSSLSCVYQVIDVWPGGFVVEITITNLSASPVPGWSVNWTWPGNQQVTSIWDASYYQSGRAVTVIGTSTIPAGGSITFGFDTIGTPAPVLPISCTPAP